MLTEKYQQFCYHGTTNHCAEEIMKTKLWINSTCELDWLGSGVYFFEKDKLQAYDYMTRSEHCKVSEFSIIKALVTTDNLLDLDDTENFNALYELIKDFIETNRKLEIDFVFKIGHFMNFLYSLSPFDAARKTYNVLKCNKIFGTHFIRTQVQVCVKEHNCIDIIERMRGNEIKA